MCGIIAGSNSEKNILPQLLEGLQSMAYRGYDSAGLTLLGEERLLWQRVTGKTAVLATKLLDEERHWHSGIAHTRWATHGAVSEANAHPQQAEQRLYLVHNGIIDNHKQQRSALAAAGQHFASDTDSEVIVQLLHRELCRDDSPLAAMRRCCQQLTGSYAFVWCDRQRPGQLFGVSHRMPLLIGRGDTGYYFASDLMALATVAHSWQRLQQGQMVALTAEDCRIQDADGISSPSTWQPMPSALQSNRGKGEYRHYMLKEIHEQPTVVANTLEQWPQLEQELKRLPLKSLRAVHLVACGSSYHASLAACHWIEHYAGLPARAEIASEYRAREVAVEEDCLLICLSQSGETADTLAAFETASKRPYRSRLAICNMANSSLATAADYCLLTDAGIEVGVASTKAHTAQLTILLLLALHLAVLRGRLHNNEQRALLEGLADVPAAIMAVLEKSDAIAECAAALLQHQGFLFLGRGLFYPVAMEGALKFKEITYLHAEAYAAGELKHGPLALVDAHTAVVSVAPVGRLLNRLMANLQEVQARGGRLYVFLPDKAAVDSLPGMHIIRLPACRATLAPFIFTPALQLLAYHAARQRGTDIDQPRNLAKSVTVE